MKFAESFLLQSFIKAIGQINGATKFAYKNVPIVHESAGGRPFVCAHLQSMPDLVIRVGVTQANLPINLLIG